MGLVRELVDELIEMPKQADNYFSSKNEMEFVLRLGYAILNLVFQFIDCVLVPYYTCLLFKNDYNFSLFKRPLVIIGVFASCFSICQFLY